MKKPWPSHSMMMLYALTLSLGFLSARAFAKDAYQYPELMVVPRASQELAAAAAEENKSRYRTHFLLEAPAFMTLLSGLSASGMKDDASKNASMIATGVGAGWLAASLAMSAYYTPYKTGLQEVNALGEKTMEQSLAKERRAEEALYYPAYVMRRIQYIATLTHFGASMAVASLEEENRNSKAIAGVAAAVAFLPLIFNHPWINRYDRQQEYKKKIYGPVAQLNFQNDSQTAQLVPSISLSFRF